MIKFFKTILCIFLIACTTTIFAAPAKQYWNKWVSFDPFSTLQITYPVWKNFLSNYTTIKDSQVYIKYAAVSKQDKNALGNEIKKLSILDIAKYNRNEQFAYWINLYNMETVYLILQNYPISSITKIKAGYFSFGPWDKKLLKVDGTELSLNDIEHRIIRPIWNDPRIHAAVNCASISCPNLLTVPFQANTINSQLNTAFSNFVNSSKGVKVNGSTLELSKIFEWYSIDFGDSSLDMKNFISYYIKPKALKQKILNTNTIAYQNYNWNLNGIK
ncbi:MAG: hypothetical protein ACJA0H_000870 [Francisellaceae bacterium]|jgi:hypothetical protein